MSQQALSREVQEIWELFRESSNQIKEVARRQEETALQMKETGKKIESLSETVNALTGKWGRFVEGLVAPGAVRIFRERGIDVKQTYTRAESQRNGEEMEIDVLVVNDEYTVAISVKSTLKVEDVNAHIDNLRRFRDFFPVFADKKLLGAVAGIVIDESADKYAYRRGLFVITQAGENIKILNDEKFKPKEW